MCLVLVTLVNKHEEALVHVYEINITNKLHKITIKHILETEIQMMNNRMVVMCPQISLIC